MALRGNLKDFSLPDVFQLVTLSGKTGVLRMKRAEAEGSVWFRDGEVFFAQSDWHSEPLGTRLVAAGRITPSALGRALDIQKAEPAAGRRLGAVLIAEGYITDKVLEAFVQEQIQDTIFDLFRWDEGDFDFEPLDAAPAEDIGLSVSIENIVMEGSRRLEEWNRIKKKIPSMEIVFKMATAPGEGTFDISLKPTEWNLLLKVDGTRSVAELARELGRTDFEVARVIYGLFSAGLLEVASDDEVERLRAERLEWESKYAKETEKIRESEERQKLEVLEREAHLVAESQERELVGRKKTVEATWAATAEMAAAAAAAADHVVEEPAFLTAETPTADDMAMFEQMIGAVLEAPAAEPQEEPVAEVLGEAPGIEGLLDAEPAVEVVEEGAPAEEPLDLLESLPPEVLEEEPAAAAHPVYEIIEEPVDAAETGLLEEIPVATFEPVENVAEVAAAEEPELLVEPAEELPVREVAEEPLLDEVPADIAPLEEAPVEAPAAEVPEALPIDVLIEADHPVPIVVTDSEIYGGTDEASAEGAQDLTDLLHALGEPDDVAEIVVAEPADAVAETEGEAGRPGEAPVLTGDYATDLMALGLGELPMEEPAAEEGPFEGLLGEETSADAEAAADLTQMLASLGEDDGEISTVLDTSSVLDEDESLLAGEAASGVISTDAFLSDFNTSDVPFSSGLLGDELTALTGGGGAQKRPQATARKLPDQGERVLRRDQHVDRALLEKIIEGVQKL